MGHWETDRLVAEVQRLAVRGLSRDQLHRELSARLRRSIGFDAACWHGLDPDTLLLTTANPEELLQHGFLTPDTEPLAAESVIASEYLRPDVNTFAALARRRSPVGVLSESTRGRPQRSARFADFLDPRGTPHELRAAFVTRHRAWGCVVLHRSPAWGDFTASEARVVARLSRPVAEALRVSLRVDAANRPEEPSAPGLLLLGPSDEPEMITAPAQRLLEPLRSLSPGARQSVPISVRTLAASARHSGTTQAVHVSTSVGWLSLHASLPDGAGARRVAIVLQPASGEQAAALHLEAHGLTSREREVATLVARGMSTKAISQRLFLSPWTVQDHLKAIFEKTGTRSRHELRAKIFFHDFLPGIATRAPLDAHGHLVHRGPPLRV